MGGQISKQQGANEPKLFAVATPHPTLQYIYPVYAAPADIEQPKGRRRRYTSSLKSWKSEKKKTRQSIKVLSEQEAFPLGPAITAPVPIAPRRISDTTSTHDGTWIHYHLDNAGNIDYVQPGTTIPSSPIQQFIPGYNNVPYIGSPVGSVMSNRHHQPSYSYPTTASVPQFSSQLMQPQLQPPLPFHSTQQLSTAQFSPSYTPAPAATTPYHGRARSVSPIRARAMTPPNYRRAATPTNPHRRMRSPPRNEFVPARAESQRIVPRRCRMGTPFPHLLHLEDSESEQTGFSRMHRVQYAESSDSNSEPDHGYTSVHQSVSPTEEDEDRTQVSSPPAPAYPLRPGGPKFRPHSPTPPSEMSSLGNIIQRDSKYHWNDYYSSSASPTAAIV